jgi:DNA-directed RNA polymerase subunit RPC12/RpoP
MCGRCSADYESRGNCKCSECGDWFFKDRDEIGDRCDRCMYLSLERQRLERIAWMLDSFK